MGRNVVMGLGNLLNTDEGVGIEALRQLEARLGEQPDLEFVDGGVLGLNLLPLVEECSRLLVLDAIDAGAAPGSLVEMSREEIPYYAGVKLSPHQLSFQEVLGLALVRDALPEKLHLLGVQPSDLEMGIGLSPLVAARLADVLERAEEILREWGILSEPGF